MPLLSDSVNLAEAGFTIDSECRVVWWSPAASVLLGFSEADVLGRQCWEIIQGKDVFGRSLPCHLCQRRLNGEVLLRAPRHTLIPQGKDGRLLRLVHQMIPLPSGADARGLVLLQPMIFKQVGTSSLPQGSTGSWGDLVRNLATLGIVAQLAATTRPDESLESSLAQVLRATGAEAAELFLFHPPTQEMFLAAHQGLFRSAFYQIPRFKIGQGFPGLVAATEEPLQTQELVSDNRYLRTRVKEKGFLSYLCVPLQTDHTFLGSLNITSRKREDNLASRLQFLNWVAQPLSNTLELTYLRGLNDLDSFSLDYTLGQSLTANTEMVMLNILKPMVAASRADGGFLLLYDPVRKNVRRRVAQPSSLPVRCSVNFPHRLTTCPVLRDGRPWVTARNIAPVGACRGSLAEASACLCLPLSVNGTILGVTSLVYSNSIPSPYRFLNLLAVMAERAGRWLAPLLDSSPANPEQSAEVSAAESKKFISLPSSTAETALLDIRCLGHFRILKEGQLLTSAHFKRRQALTVLKILLTRRGRPVSKDYLIECLWPDSDPTAAAKRLWIAIHCLRQALKLDKPAHFIETEGDSYRFVTGASGRVDVDEFLQTITRGESLEARGDSHSAWQEWQKAAQLYQGDFLEEEAYSEWCLAEREYLREVYLSLLKRIARLYEQQGDYEHAILYYRQSLAKDNLREESQRCLMVCLAKAGRRDEALRLYAQYRKLLWAELGVEPLEETQGIYQQLLESSQVDKGKPAANTLAQKAAPL